MASKAWFSDSSDAGKSEFKEKLTFPHPDASGETVFCTWHGLEYFAAHPQRATTAVQESMRQQVFGRRLDLAARLGESVG